MLFEVALDVLCCFDRATLEDLQMHSRYLRDFIKSHARTLPLRHIHSVEIKYGSVHFHPTEDRSFAIIRVQDEKDLQTILYGLNNAFIRRFAFDFRQPNLPLLEYLKANASDLHCQVGALHMQDAAVDVNYTLFDFLGVHLKPQILETSIWAVTLGQDRAMLFTRNTLRSSVKHLIYEVDGPPAPECIIPELFGVRVIETCALTTAVDPRPWIGNFAEVFGMAKLGTDIVRSVTMIHTRRREVSQWAHTSDPLGTPQSTDVPTPCSAYVKKWSMEQRRRGYTITESTVAELFVFENSRLESRLEVFAWTIKKQNEFKHIVLHHAFLLQVIYM